jgi:hypothetical protein
MRRKNLYITEVDVYLVGINLSKSAQQSGKDWALNHKSDVSLVQHIMGNPTTKLPAEVKVSATLRFQRDISKDQFLTAFEEAFKGCDADAIVDFKARIGKVIAAQGNGAVTKKEELVLYFLDNGTVLFSLNGVFGEKLENVALNRRLLEIYIDPARTVSKELFTSLEKNLADLD